MSIDLTYQFPQDFAPESRVWIYQSDRPFSSEELNGITQLLKDFVDSWTSHGAKVKGYATVLFDYFIIFMADESATGVSGCSTDSSVRIVKDIENKYKVDLFNRQNLAFIIQDNLELIPLSKLNELLENGTLTPETIYFNNTVLSKIELDAKWINALKNSWLSNKFITENQQ